MSEKPTEEMKRALKLPATVSGSGSDEFLQLVQREFHLSGVKSIKAVDSVLDGKDTVLYLSFVREFTIEGQELKQANGLVAELGGTLTLRFDKSGLLDSYALDDSADQGIKETKAGVIGLLNKREIYFAEPGEKVDVSKLARERIPFYMQEDSSGRKRLFRAYVS